jgi:hypothetical protein
MRPKTWQHSENYCHRRNISSQSPVLDFPRPPVGLTVLHVSNREIRVERAPGIPTFRGSGGLWRKYDAMSLASYSAFKTNPSRVWQFYHYRREKSVIIGNIALPAALTPPSTILASCNLEPSPLNLTRHTSLSPSSQ